MCYVDVVQAKSCRGERVGDRDWGLMLGEPLVVYSLELI